MAIVVIYKLVFVIPLLWNDRELQKISILFTILFVKFVTCDMAIHRGLKVMSSLMLLFGIQGNGRFILFPPHFSF